jgi:DNA primase
VNVEIESDQEEVGANEGEIKDASAPTSFTEIAFAELLVHRIETHNLEMENDSTNYILSKYKQSLDEGTLPSTQSFFTDTSPEVQTRAANMLVNKYSLSENWANKHHIFAIREEEVLEQALSSATTRLLLFDVQRNIDTVIKALSSKGISDEEVNRLLIEKIKLDRIVSDLNASLGVVILPK